ncbi:altered inheritance of mitochondria protein 3-like [Olea europaea var. sylvestris]|uniref:altered inheritance of mitochondria protein 3-like n=1 Tax=Olea europaea var. sylvestris TaxID=158386 RepID=UPI000C1D8237|nr:altered inheritance of mitochondria protein 3-like [Olea europaea var. sylvestris]
MASGLSGRGRDSGTKSFDFGSDDILCSYEDFGNQDGNNGNHADPSFLANSTKEFHKNRVARSSGFPTTYSPPEESSFNQDVICTVDKTMKKYSDNLMRFLEGISSRLSQLELYCYNLDKSIGEMHSELVRDHGEAETKLKFLEKHVQEVHRSVQIIRDKQELAEAQKELAKLNLVQKESSLASNSQQNEDRPSQPAIEAKKSDNSSDAHGQQLALTLPHQVAPQPLPPVQPIEHQQAPPMAPPPSLASHSMAQAQSYYLPPSQVQYLPTQTQVQDLSRMAPQQTQSNQSPQVQSLPQYQQQWTQQPPQQVQQPQQLHMQPQIRSSSPALYPSYPPNQPNLSAEMTPNSMPMQVSYSVTSQLGTAGPEAMSYGYGGVGRPSQPQPPLQHPKTAYNAQSGDGYMPSGPRPALPSGNAYMIFDGEGGRTHQPTPQSHFQQNAYPPSSVPPQNPQHMAGSNMMIRPPQLMRSHPYNDLIEKLAGMGYRADHVVGVIQRLEESGQPIDYNAVLDRLNGHSSGGSQRGWSG